MSSVKDELLEYYNGDQLSADVWKSKYSQRFEATPTDMHSRMARELVKAEERYLLSEEDKGIYGRFKPSKHLSKFGKELPESLKPGHILEYLNRYKYIIPQGSIMSMLGSTSAVGSLSNCFVIPSPLDSYGGIFMTDQQIAQLEKRRGGVGLNLNSLRPDGTRVTNAAGTSTGAHSFMDRFSSTTREVAQNGRRGALMLLMDCRHPDIFKFVEKKKDKTKVTGANISVQLTDKFMKAVLGDEDFLCRFPIEQDFGLGDDTGFVFTKSDYNELITLASGVKVMKIKAKELYDLIVENAWDNAEPGVAFMDTILGYCPEGVYEQYKPVASNPCGEQWMQAYDACRLLALNLYNIVKKHFEKDAAIDYEKLYEIAYIQQRLADDIVDIEIDHIDKILTKIYGDPEPIETKQTEITLWKNIKQTAMNSRRTGCGFTALADMLASLNLKYDSDEAIAVIKEVMKTKLRAELDCTIDLAILRGAFDGWDKTKEFQEVKGKLVGANKFYQMIVDEFPEQAKRMYIFGRRNVSWSTVAPTGTVSLVAILENFSNTSAGVEPQFATHFFRNKKINPSDENSRVDMTDQNGDTWMTYPVVMGGFKEYIKKTYNKVDFIGVENLSKEVIDELFKTSPYYGACANDIDWKKRIEIQSIVQRYTTNAISSTLNLPNDVTKETVSNIYKAAWESGLKGVTVYRDGCRTGVLVTKKEASSNFEYHDAPKRPEELPCEIFTTVAKGKKWNVIVGLMDGKPYEVFAIDWFTDRSEMSLKKVGKGRYDLILKEEIFSEDVTSEMTDEESALTRMISTALRHGSSIDFIVEQLNKSHGSVVSFSKAISRVLAKFAKRRVNGQKCLNCGSENLKLQEGCQTCQECGNSKCS